MRLLGKFGCGITILLFVFSAIAADKPKVQKQIGGTINYQAGILKGKASYIVRDAITGKIKESSDSLKCNFEVVKVIKQESPSKEKFKYIYEVKVGVLYFGEKDFLLQSNGTSVNSFEFMAGATEKQDWLLLRLDEKRRPLYFKIYSKNEVDSPDEDNNFPPVESITCTL